MRVSVLVKPTWFLWKLRIVDFKLKSRHILYLLKRLLHLPTWMRIIKYIAWAMKRIQTFCYINFRMTLTKIHKYFVYAHTIFCMIILLENKKNYISNRNFLEPFPLFMMRCLAFPFWLRSDKIFHTKRVRHSKSVFGTVLLPLSKCPKCRRVLAKFS